MSRGSRSRLTERRKMYEEQLSKGLMNLENGTYTGGGDTGMA